MWDKLLAPISNMFTTIWGSFFDSPELRAIKEQGKLDLIKSRSDSKIRLEEATTTAKITLKQNDADAQNNIDLITVKNQRYTFKDDALVYTWLGIFICCFLPWTQPYVKTGFEFLKESTPDYFQYILYAITISELGLRRMFMVLMEKIPSSRKLLKE